jgi:hypothetical protein
VVGWSSDTQDSLDCEVTVAYPPWWSRTVLPRTACCWHCIHKKHRRQRASAGATGKDVFAEHPLPGRGEPYKACNLPSGCGCSTFGFILMRGLFHPTQAHWKDE